MSEAQEIDPKSPRLDLGTDALSILEMAASITPNVQVEIPNWAGSKTHFYDRPSQRRNAMAKHRAIDEDERSSSPVYTTSPASAPSGAGY